MSKETLEEAAGNYGNSILNKDGTAKFDFIEGAKWQAERSKEDIIHFAEWLSKNEWVKKTMTHPNKVGQYYSHKHCEFKTIEQLYETYKKGENNE